MNRYVKSILVLVEALVPTSHHQFPHHTSNNLFSLQYRTIEEPVRRKILTSSAIAVASKLKGFEVIPEDVNFGVLREGSTYTFKFTLKNTGIDSCHFKVKPPPPSTGIKVVYNPGPVS
jgi:hypothetical protein